jgi:hypothetical protein
MTTYDWRRFWIPRGKALNLSEDGYLIDPDSKYGLFYNPELKTLDELSSVPCLILLGDPGIGKSVELASQFECLRAKANESESRTIWCNLRNYQTDLRLCHSLFENEQFQAWLKDRKPLYLFLDGFDEGLLTVNVLATLLPEEFKKYSLDHLYLRIACRTFDWPSILEEGLTDLWGKDSVKVYQLAPLRRKDVALAAGAEDLNSELFLEEIYNKDAVPLAVRPISLKFLLKTFRDKKKLPSSQKSLYFDGCRLLCAELNESRITSGRSGQFTRDQRLLVAMRLAAVTIFGNRAAIWTHSDLTEMPSEDVSILDLVGGSEICEGSSFEVDINAIRETLDSGLFTDQGKNRTGWAHQTYAEFLAAQYVLTHNSSLRQLKSLVVHPGDPGERLIPQLQETIAWLATSNGDIFNAVIDADPSILLRSDLSEIGNQEKAALVQSLLKLHEREAFPDIGFGLRREYKKIFHPSIAKQLRPYLLDNQRGKDVRYFAVEVAEANGLFSLRAELLQIVLNVNEDMYLRRSAAWCLVRDPDEKTKDQMKRLAVDSTVNSADEVLIGSGLMASWPSHLNSTELFSVLTDPGDFSQFGAYQSFLSNNVIKDLKISDLPIAIDWVRKQRPRHFLSSVLARLIDEILLMAWNNLSSPEVLDHLAPAIFARLANHDPIVGGEGQQEEDLATQFRKLLKTEIERRHKVLKAAVCCLRTPEEAFFLAQSWTPLATTEDTPWILGEITSDENISTRDYWVRLLFEVLDWSNADHVGLVKKSFITDATLFQSLVQERKRHRLARQQLARFEKDKRKPLPILDPLPSVRIVELLDKLEGGELAVWCNINTEMQLRPHDTVIWSGLDPDLTQLPGWQEATDSTRARIVSAAEAFVKGWILDDPEGTKTKGLTRAEAAGYRALRLLLVQDRCEFDSLSGDVWKKWASIVLMYPFLDEGTKDGPDQALMTTAYRHAPTEILEALDSMIDNEVQQRQHVFILGRIECSWDDKLASLVLQKAQDPSLDPTIMGELVSVCLNHGDERAEDFLKSLIKLPLSTAEKERRRIITASCLLIDATKGSSWSTVWPILKTDGQFATAVISQISHPHFDGTAFQISKHLSDQDLADLYVDLSHLFPHSEDPHYEHSHTAGPREEAMHFRENVLSALAQRGTYKACDAVRLIASRLPYLRGLKRVALRAEEHARRQTWIPPRPKDIIRLINNDELRLVQNGKQLLDVLTESLNRLEAKLHGEIPEVRYLWNMRTRGKGRPKEENDLSDRVKIHFDSDIQSRGIIANREVQIHRGQRTDIHIDAIVIDPRNQQFDKLTTIVEVKGCWNKSLFTAMKDQLRDKYLVDNHCDYGLYLVAWFNCVEWDGSDKRRSTAFAQCPDIIKLKQQLASQALELSINGKHIIPLVLNCTLSGSRPRMTRNRGKKSGRQEC